MVATLISSPALSLGPLEVSARPVVDWTGIFDNLTASKAALANEHRDPPERLIRQEKIADSWAMSEGLD
jgi:hypothetical protein